MIDLLKGHGTFFQQVIGKERHFLKQLAGQQQNPNALFIGCSDSRVIPEMLTQSAPGELFVVRNVANVVPAFEDSNASVGAAVEFAVGYLRVPHVIVCGHYGCGGVKAACDGLHLLENVPTLVEWLRPVEALVSVATAHLSPDDADKCWRTAVEVNVLAQLKNLSTYDLVRTAVERGELELHAWIYDLYSLNLFVYDVEAGHFVQFSQLLD